MSEENLLNSSEVLKSQTSDYVATAAKSVLGIVPFAGSLLAEVAGTIIPNQRIDRISKFAQVLEQKLSKLEQKFIRLQLTNENFTDLLEEGVRQAARSLSDERREYIASIIANGLSSENIEYIESKHLLRILEEINDIEIIWLRYYLEPSENKDNEFRNKHREILKPIFAYIGAPLKIHDKSTLQESYYEHLVQLGLLKRRYKINMKTQEPEFDKLTGEQKINRYEITYLGEFLLRQIDLSNI